MVGFEHFFTTRFHYLWNIYNRAVFAKIVNRFYLLTVFAKGFIIDVLQHPKYTYNE